MSARKTHNDKIFQGRARKAIQEDIMKKYLSLSLFIFSIFLIAPGCGKKNIPVMVNNSKPPQRIVSLAPDLTEIVFELGLADKVVAVSNDSDYPPAAREKNKTGSFWQPDIESIIAVKPDLVIALWFEQQKSVADSLNRLGIKTLTIQLERIDHLYNAISEIGIATGYQKQAKELCDKIRNQINNIREKCSSSSRPKVLWVVQQEPLRVVGRDTFLNEVIEIAGGENCIGSTLFKYPQIDSEQLLINKPEIIIHSTMGTKDIAAQQKAAEIFWSQKAVLPAVKNKKIFVVDSDLVQRVGPRLPQGIETIASVLHPELFKQIVIR
jgi:iron complex transport system substrate-binding protein